MLYIPWPFEKVVILLVSRPLKNTCAGQSWYTVTIENSRKEHTEPFVIAITYLTLNRALDWFSETISVKSGNPLSVIAYLGLLDRKALCISACGEKGEWLYQERDSKYTTTQTTSNTSALTAIVKTGNITCELDHIIIS